MSTIFWKKTTTIALLLVLSLSLLSTATFISAANSDEYLNKISTGGYEDTPVIALDTNGNVHIVWASGEGKVIKYSMFDSMGSVLIDETTINPCPVNKTKHDERPSMVVDSENKIHIVFHGFSLYENINESGYTSVTTLNASEVIYLKFDPYLDDRSGDAADFYEITEIPETIISTIDNVKSRASNIAIDSFDRIHVSWFEGDPRWSGTRLMSIKYLTMNTSGGVLVPETLVTAGLTIDVDWGEPEILTDSSGNAHIVYCTNMSVNEETCREIFYTMIDGDNGTPLIDDTAITANDSHASVRAYMDIDAMDMIHIIWHDKRFYDNGTGEHELFYSKIDPSLDDQSGNTADPNVISLVSEKMITTNDDHRSYLNDLVVDPSGYLHVVWVDQREYAKWGQGELYYEILNSVGDPLTLETRITWFENKTYPSYWWDSSARNPDLAVSAEQLYITFNGYDETSELSDIYLLIPGIHPPIAINGNSDFTPANGVSSGTGTPEDPYIIENLVIGASTAHGILITNADAYFVIKNCIIVDGGQNFFGIYLENVPHGTIENCTVYDNYYGIFLWNANNTTITGSTAHDNLYIGIYLRTSSNNTITNSTIFNNPEGIYLESSPGTEIHYCDIYNNSQDGIFNNVLEPAFVANAIHCYWGSIDGPGGVGTGTGDYITANVLYEPWLSPVKLNATLTMLSSNASVAPGSTITLHGILSPAKTGSVTIFRSINNGAFMSIGDSTLTNGNYTFVTQLNDTGTYAFYAYWAGTENYNPSTSATTTVTATGVGIDPLWYVVIGGVVIVVIAVAVYFLRRR